LISTDYSRTRGRAAEKNDVEIGLWWRNLGAQPAVSVRPVQIVNSTPSTALERPRAPGRVIDRILVIALQLGADQRPVRLQELREAYCARWPESAAGSFDATLNYHTINMRSRFPKPKDPKTEAAWMREPLFQRTGRGAYQLLSGRAGRAAPESPGRRG
jgi:hypothetical protein